MADQSEKEFAAVFNLLKISLSKTDPTLDKSNALKGLVVLAVARAEAAGKLKSGNPNQIATDGCITLRYLTGGLLTSGVARVERSTSSAPDPNRLQIVNFALGELGTAAIKSKSDVAKMKAADIKLLAEYLQQHLDHDPQDGEPLNFDKDYVMVDGAYPYSKSGNPTAADIKQGLRAFLAG